MPVFNSPERKKVYEQLSIFVQSMPKLGLDETISRFEKFIKENPMGRRPSSPAEAFSMALNMQAASAKFELSDAEQKVICDGFLQMQEWLDKVKPLVKSVDLTVLRALSALERYIGEANADHTQIAGAVYDLSALSMSRRAMGLNILKESRSQAFFMVLLNRQIVEREIGKLVLELKNEMEAG